MPAWIVVSARQDAGCGIELIATKTFANADDAMTRYAAEVAFMQRRGWVVTEEANPHPTYGDFRTYLKRGVGETAAVGAGLDRRPIVVTR